MYCAKLSSLQVSAFQSFFHLFVNGVQIKTESGSKAKTNKTGIYKKWKDQSHKRISLNGTNDGNSAAQSTSLAGNDLEPLC